MPSALVVEDEPAVRELFSRWLEGLGFTPRETKDGAEALHVLKNDEIALVITDIGMPVMDGLTLLRHVRALAAAPPVIVVTGANDVRTAVQAMKLGARDYLPKPVKRAAFEAAVDLVITSKYPWIPPPELEESEHSAMDPDVEQMVARLASPDISDSLLDALVMALDARAHEAGSHSRRVSQLALLLGRACGITGEHLANLGRGALLHDLGKIGVSDAILRKMGPLTELEWAEMRLHPEIGARILSKVRHLRPVATMVLHHHERFDGTGYPGRLASADIPLASRIFAVVDTIDAMLIDRPYRKAKTKQEAISELQRCAGRQFDPEVVEAFLGISEEEWTFLYQAAGTAHS
ncbi:MAG: HD domain-containing phosphohydrolase [Bryobacteraceae bacterium]